MPIRQKTTVGHTSPRPRRETRPVTITGPEIKRLIASVKKSGLEIAAVCFTPDGVVKVLTPSMAVEVDGNAFDEWKDRL